MRWASGRRRCIEDTSRAAFAPGWQIQMDERQAAGRSILHAATTPTPEETRSRALRVLTQITWSALQRAMRRCRDGCEIDLGGVHPNQRHDASAQASHRTAMRRLHAHMQR